MSKSTSAIDHRVNPIQYNKMVSRPGNRKDKMLGQFRHRWKGKRMQTIQVKNHMKHNNQNTLHQQTE